MSKSLNDLDLQGQQMLWARVHELKRENYRIDQIAYLVDKPIKMVKQLLNMEKPKKPK